MSYGQPWRRTTGGPLAGPASAYPTLRRPASICFSGPNDVFVPGLILGRSFGFVLVDCPSAELTPSNPAAATDLPIVPKRRRRLWLISLDILTLLILDSPMVRFDRVHFWITLV